MTMITDFGKGLVFQAATDTDRRPYALDETYWGYVIRPRGGASPMLVTGQLIAWFMGICFVVAGAGMWILPLTAESGNLLPFRFGVTVLFLGFAAMLLWFASRGSISELQVDTRLGEVREVVRNRAGRPTLLGRYGFDSIGGVFLDRSHVNQRLGGRATLCLRWRNTAQVLHLVHGAESDLVSLRDRLGRDLLVRNRGFTAPKRAA